MRPHHLWGASVLLLTLGIAGLSATENVENSPRKEGKVRYQRKVLVSRSPVATTPASPASPAPPTHAPPAPAASTGDSDTAAGARATRSAADAAQDRLYDLLSDYVRGSGSDLSNNRIWPKRPFQVDLPLYGEGSGRGSTVPVFVLPIPIPMKNECPADRDRPGKYDVDRDDYAIDVRSGLGESLREKPRRPAYDELRRPVYDDPRKPVYDESRRPVYDDPRRPAYDEPRRPAYDEPRRPAYDEPSRPSKYDEPRHPSTDFGLPTYDYRRPSFDEPRRPVDDKPRRPVDDKPRRPIDDKPRRPIDDKPRRPIADEPSRRRPIDDEPRRRPNEEPAPRPYLPSRPAPFSKPEHKYNEPSIMPPPTMRQGGPVESGVLVELFRAQQPLAPELPAVLTRDRRRADYPPAPTSAPAPTPHAGEPPRPRFNRPLAVRGSLTVHRADYTEPYTAWWDPATGNSRVDFNEGTTTTYRTMQNNRVRRAAVSKDRTGETDVDRCSVMQAKPATEADRAPPMLPDMQQFSFHGHVEMDGQLAEMWKHTLSSRPGEDGGARGEALTYRHEMLLMRHNDDVKPLMYSVSVDSSVLGANCDGYVHRYHEVHEHKPDPKQFEFEPASQCNSVSETEDMSVVEPLREFTRMKRDTKYDDLFTQFTKDYERTYVDSAEEAVRKNLLTQTSRFVSAGNRLGATFEMALNFLSDRLDAEVGVLLGVELDDEHFPAESFPHERSKLRDLADSLPDEFDWRQRGGVTPVKYQGSCSSCWAFAVAGAVEGALFRKTRRLVALSEQCLVDCSQPYGGNGCKGTWPSHAYDYVQDRGLPAEKEYIPYMSRVLECQDKVVKPVTQISAHVNVTQHSVPALKVAIRRHAPSVVIIDAALKSFQTYKKGIFYDDRCNKARKKLKHAVLAVGWGQRKGEPHFILKNSWSAAWGDGGYVRVHGPSNTCGVLTLPSYPRLEARDVLRDLGPLAAPAPAPQARADDSAELDD